MFDRFYHVNHGRCAGQGSGLGLSIAKSLIEAHGGQTRISSVVGKGTSIIVCLPVSSRQDTQSPSRTNAKPKHQKLKWPIFRKMVSHFSNR
ncbi:MAG: ATP-binding protein [Anaerolineae bacterium]|nr:ATP-binding protein [Anaerolineae bacterium]